MIAEIYSKILDKIYKDDLPMPKNCDECSNIDLVLMNLYYNSILSKNNFAYLTNKDSIEIISIGDLNDR